MSATFAGNRQVCRVCGRSVAFVIDEDDGRRIVVDPEIITVAVYVLGSSGPTCQVKARRLHAEMCLKYKLEREKAEARRKLGGK